MKNETGFTLVELLITLLVAAILMAVAIPAFNDLIQNNRVTAANNDLVSALAVARSEAIRRREPVTLCGSINLTACAGNANWETGWILFNDRDSDGIVDAGVDNILRVWEAIPAGFTMTATGGATLVRFDRLGAANPGETFQLSNPDCVTGQANRERSITVAGSGTVSAIRTNCP